MKKRTLLMSALTLATAAATLSGAAHAQDFPPKKPVTLVVGFAAGGAADAAARDSAEAAIRRGAGVERAVGAGAAAGSATGSASATSVGMGAGFGAGAGVVTGRASASSVVAAASSAVFGPLVAQTRAPVATSATGMANRMILLLALLFGLRA